MPEKKGVRVWFAQGAPKKIKNPITYVESHQKIQCAWCLGARSVSGKQMPRRLPTAPLTAGKHTRMSFSTTASGRGRMANLVANKERSAHSHPRTLDPRVDCTQNYTRSLTGCGTVGSRPIAECTVGLSRFECERGEE